VIRIFIVGVDYNNILFFLPPRRNPLAQMEEEKREHDAKMKKMEAEMEQVFEMKVKEKKQKLKDSEQELTRRHEERKKVRYWFM
jgi:Skp family chaperone for outer membrane proteins